VETPSSSVWVVYSSASVGESGSIL
jgi:hypothetical protein